MMRRHGYSICKRLLALTLFTAAVAVGVDAQESAPAAPAPQAEATAPAEAAPAVSLDDCLTASLAGAPALKTAKLDLDTSAAQMADAIGNNGLTLGESAGYSYQFPPFLGNPSSSIPGSNVTAGLTLTGGPATDPTTSVDLSVQPGFPNTGGLSTLWDIKGSQVVFDGYPGGRPSGLVKQARYSFQIAQVAYDAALEQLAYQVKQAYYTLLGDQKSLIAKDATLKAAQIELSQMQGYLTAGRATSLDVLQFQVALTQAQLDLRTQQNAINTDRKKLSLAIGWPLDKDYGVQDVSSPGLPSLDTKQALETAYANRPELKTYDLDAMYAGVDLSLQKVPTTLPFRSTGASDSLRE